MIKEIVTDLNDLDYICNEVEEGESYKNIVSELKKTIKKNKIKALSAPAIGYNRRVFCINYDIEPKTYINPIIIKASGIALSEESCTSIPGRKFMIPRNKELDVIYTNTKGEIVQNHLTGMASFVFQHEMDHLNGVTLVDLGLELDDDYFEASDEEKQEIVDMYLHSLSDRLDKMKEEINSTPELAKLDEQVRFYEAVARGEVQFEEKGIEKDESNTDKKDE